MSFLALLYKRTRWVQAPVALLSFILQRTPLLRLASTAEALLAPSAGALVKSTLTLAALGAYDTVAGATVITPSPASPASAKVGDSFSAAFTITGANGGNATPGSWSVLLSSLPPGLALNGASASGLLNTATRTVAILGTPTAAGSYAVKLTAWQSSNRRGSSQLLTYTINVTDAPVAVAPTFSTQPLTQTVNTGTNVIFTVAVTGTPAPTLQWFKGTTALPGQTASTLTLSSVTTADAGAYKAVATNSAAPAGMPSTTATLAVNAATTTAPSFTQAPASNVSADYGSRLTLAVTTAGTPAPTLQWRKGTAILPGQNGASLVLDPVALTDAGAYSVVATNSAGTATAATTVSVVVPPPILPAAPTNLKTGSVVDLSLTGGQPVPAGLAYKATGVPAGLALDPASGRLSGVFAIKPGTAKITAWTQVGSTKSATRVLSFPVAAFPASLLGGYEALLDAGAPDHLPVGKLSLKVVTGGAYTGQLVAPDLATFPLKGSLALSDGDLRAGAAPTLARPAGATAYTLAFTITDPSLPAEPALVATVSAAGATIGAGTGARLATAAPTKESVAAYTFLLADPAPLGFASVNHPLGAGWATGKIAATGVLTLTGQNADATKLTATLALGADATYRLYVKPYAKLIGGYVAGPLPLRPRPDAPARRHVAPADGAGLVWRKPDTRAAGVNYPAGFGPLALSARLEPWLKPTAAAPLPAALGLPASGQLTLGIDAAGLVNVASDPFGATLPRTLKLDAKNLFTVVSATTPLNPTAFTAKVNVATGALTGGFTVPAIPTGAARKVAYTGVLLQPAPTDRPGLVGGGFFLLPATTKGGPTPSGAVELATP
jgi:hypothetical protein